MKDFKRVTLQDVAREAKVSYASVSAVLNGKDGKSIRVGAQTKEKILESAARLGYVPNMAARKLKNGSNSLIAVFTYEQIFPVESENEYYRFFVGIQETAEKYGYDILILNNRPTEENSSRIVLADGAVRNKFINYYVTISRCFCLNKKKVFSFFYHYVSCVIFNVINGNLVFCSNLKCRRKHKVKQ